MLNIGKQVAPRFVLNKRADWPEFERIMINAAKRYGAVERTLMRLEEPRFEVSATPSATRSSGSSHFNESILLEELKELRKSRKEYEDYSREFVGLLIDSLGISMERIVRIHPKFLEAYSGNSVLELWKIILDICTKDVVQDLDEAKHHLWNIRQGDTSFEEYILDIEQRSRVLLGGKVEISQEDIVTIFIQGLNMDIFADKVAEIKARKGTDGYPTDFLKAKEIFRIWSDIRLRASGSQKVKGYTMDEQVQAMDISKVVCYKCKKRGHVRRDCPEGRRERVAALKKRVWNGL
jgi:hypothetical protein